MKASGVKGWDNLSEQQILGKFATNNGINVGTLLAGGSFTLDFDLEPLAQLYSNDMFTYLIDGGYMTIDEATDIATRLRKTAGTSYAWVEYSFKRGGRTYTGSTEPVMQKIQLPADLTSYEEVFQLDPDSGVYYAAIVITNSGFGTSDEILLTPPEIPSLNGARYNLSSYHTGSMKDFPGGDATPEYLAQWYQGWLNNPVPEEIKLDPIPSGESIYIIYKINVIGKKDPGVPTEITPHPIELPAPPLKIDFKPTIYIGGKPVDALYANPARLADLIDEISDSLSIMMYSTVGDFGTRVEDAYTNAKLMQTAKVIVGVQKYLSFISTVVSNVLGFFGARTTEVASLGDGDDGNDEKSLVDKFLNNVFVIGAITEAADGIGTALESQVEGNLKQLRGLGSMKPSKMVYAELVTSLGDLDEKISAFDNIVNSALYVYDSLIKQACSGVDNLPKLEETMNGLISDWIRIRGEIALQHADVFLNIQQLYTAALGYQLNDNTNYYHYDEVLKKLLRASDVITMTNVSILELDAMVYLVKSPAARRLSERL